MKMCLQATSTRAINTKTLCVVHKVHLREIEYDSMDFLYLHISV